MVRTVNFVHNRYKANLYGFHNNRGAEILKKHVEGIALLIAGLLLSLPVLAQNPPAKDATSAEEVLGPVDASKPLESTPPAAPGTAGEQAAPDAAAAEEEDQMFVDEDAERERRERKGLGVAVRASTLGFGVEVIKSVSTRVNLRVQYNGFNYSKDVDDSDITYQGKLKWQTYGLLADWHPFKGSFRLSGGAYHNGNKIGLSASCPNGCDVGDDTKITSTGPNPATITGDVRFKSLSPYLGFGWGNAMKGWPLHFGFDIGVLFQGSPKIDLAATGNATVTDKPSGTTTGPKDIGSDPTVQAEVIKEEKQAQDDSSQFKLWPVISFTIGYRFSF